MLDNNNDTNGFMFEKFENAQNKITITRKLTYSKNILVLNLHSFYIRFPKGLLLDKMELNLVVNNFFSNQ